MKSIQQTRDEFFRLMADNGFESTGTADYDGNVIFAREWTRSCQTVWYGEHASTYRVTARISFGTLLIQLASPAEKQSMMKRLVENYDIDEVKVFEPSLNDIFVEYAGAQV